MAQVMGLLAFVRESWIELPVPGLGLGLDPVIEGVWEGNYCLLSKTYIYVIERSSSGWYWSTHFGREVNSDNWAFVLAFSS